MFLKIEIFMQTNFFMQTHTHTSSKWGHSIDVMFFILYKLYIISPYLKTLLNFLHFKKPL